ncbi:hypothetical protein L2E82_14816 [Cichorium intybus]|uniref:Uncharacterized protein n=1 Tax=Cichorium intybus TaxID=13427 RepID=A0ACB9F1H1_CICIN|nr:hypothetical protein L2E82_14816 [Cichorium intybus]
MGNQDGGVVLCSTNPPMESQESSSKCCDECKTNAFKYKCPGCSVRSCSLPCVKAHKQRTGCTGKRQQQTEFVPLSKFDDNLLLSDYSMLEDVKRIADSAKRMRVQLCGKYYNGLPFYLKHLLKAAQSRRTRLFFLPTGMSKRETNKTSYNNREKSISWTIEWHFHSTNVKLIDHGVHENSNLYSVIQNHLKPGPINHPLKPFCLEPVESLRFFISKHPKNPRSPFRELDIYAPIRQQFSNLVIVEYPVIHVFLPSHNIKFEVVKDIVPHRVQPKSEPVNDSQPSPKGVFFKEEEIKDQDSSDPHVLDLMNQSNSKMETKNEVVKDIIPHLVQPKSTDSQPGSKGVIFKEEEIKDQDSSDTHVLHLMNQSNGKMEKKNEGIIQDSTNDVGVVDSMSFDFDSELMDVYSNLISETNPDDFLDLDGLLCDDMHVQDKEGKFGGAKEELEEGEIADSD